LFYSIISETFDYFDRFWLVKPFSIQHNYLDRLWLVKPLSNNTNYLNRLCYILVGEAFE